MRIKINLTENLTNIPINNQELVNSYIHRCLGNNNSYHDNISNYSISNIRGGKLNNNKETLDIKKPFIIVSSNDITFINSLLIGIGNNNNFNDKYNILVTGIEFINEMLHDGFNLFKTLTPILLKEKINGCKKRTITVNDDDFIPKLKESIIRKIKMLSPDSDLTNFDIKLADNSIKKTKMITIKNVTSVGSLCDLIIVSNKKTAELIYNFGIGQSTGSGFGTVYEYKNHNIYHENV